MSDIADNKRIAKNTIFLYFRQLVVMAISLYTSRLILAELGVEDFGIYNVIGGVVALLTVLSGTVSAAMSRFYTFELGRKDISRLKNVFSTSLCVIIALSAVIFLIAEVFGNWVLRECLVIPPERMDSAYVVLQASVLSFAINLLSSPFWGAIMAYEKMKVYAYMGMLEAFMKLFVAFSLGFTIFDKLETYSVLICIMSFIILLIFIVYSNNKIEGCSLRLKFDKDIFFSLSKYATWSMFGMVSYVGYTYSYNIILNVFFGPVVNAARGVAIQIQTAIQSFANNFQASMNPQIIKNYASNNIDRMHLLILSSSRYSFYLMLLLALPVIIEADFILSLWLVEVPPYTSIFVRIVLCAICIEVLAGPMIIAQNSTGDIKKFQIITGISMLLSLPVSYYLFIIGFTPEYLYYVYTLFTVITQILRVLITCPYVGLSKMKYLKEVVLNIMLVTIVAIPLPLFVCYMCSNDVIRFVLVCLISVISVLTTVYFLGIKDNERELVKVKVNSWLNYRA